MRPSTNLLVCCPFLAGRVDAQLQAVARTADFSRPVTAGEFLVDCGPLGGIIPYPVPLADKDPVNSEYEDWQSRNDLSVAADMAFAKGNARISAEIPGERDARGNASFFVHGLAGGCVGVFAATRGDTLRTEAALVRRLADSDKADPVRAAAILACLGGGLRGADPETVRNVFGSDQRWKPLKEVPFADGTVLGTDAIAQMTFGGSAAADRMDGTVLGDGMTGRTGCASQMANPCRSRRWCKRWRPSARRRRAS